MPKRAKVRRCRTSGKHRFKDSIAAKIALAEIRRIDRPTAHEQSAYRCPSCGGWHLTSRPPGGQRVS